MNMGTLLRGAIVLGLIWAAVWGMTSWSGARKATPEKVSGMILSFEDWSVEYQSVTIRCACNGG